MQVYNGPISVIHSSISKKVFSLHLNCQHNSVQCCTSKQKHFATVHNQINEELGKTHVQVLYSFVNCALTFSRSWWCKLNTISQTHQFALVLSVSWPACHNTFYSITIASDTRISSTDSFSLTYRIFCKSSLKFPQGSYITYLNHWQ